MPPDIIQAFLENAEDGKLGRFRQAAQPGIKAESYLDTSPFLPFMRE